MGIFTTNSRLGRQQRRRYGQPTVYVAFALALCAPLAAAQTEAASEEPGGTSPSPAEDKAEAEAEAEVNPEAPAPDASASGGPAVVDAEQLASEVRQELAGAQPSPAPLEPPLPDEAAFDWLRFDSGEWIGGDLKEMRDRRVTFDSDQFDMVTEDWDDVVEFRSSRHYNYVDSDLKSHEGPGIITVETVSVRTAAGIVTFPRADLLSVVASSAREIDRWSLKFSLAATARRGNTDSVDLNNYVSVRRQDHVTRGTLESTTNLGGLSGNRTVQNWNGLVKADVFVHRSFYLTPAFVSGQHNYFQNLSFRGALAGGAGVHALDLSWLTWDLDALGGYQYTDYLSAPAGTVKTFDDVMIGLGTSLEWDITGDIDLDVDWRSFLVATEMGRTYHNGSARFSLEITEIFDFDLAAALYRIEEPAADEDGVVPASNDWTFTAGIGLELN